MSIRALCLGVRDHLRATFNDAEGKWITYQPLGDPPPAMGQRAMVVRGAGFQWAGTEGGDGHDKYFSATILVYVKVAFAPTDRRGPMLLEEGTDNLLDWVDQLPGYFVNRYEWMALANAKITGYGTATNGFVETFKSASGTDVEGYNPPWADPENPPTILRASVTLRNARRIRVDGTVA